MGPYTVAYAMIIYMVWNAYRIFRSPYQLEKIKLRGGDYE